MASNECCLYCRGVGQLLAAKYLVQALSPFRQSMACPCLPGYCWIQLRSDHWPRLLDSAELMASGTTGATSVLPCVPASVCCCTQCARLPLRGNLPPPCLLPSRLAGARRGAMAATPRSPWAAAPPGPAACCCTEPWRRVAPARGPSPQRRRRARRRRPLWGRTSQTATCAGSTQQTSQATARTSCASTSPPANATPSAQAPSRRTACTGEQYVHALKNGQRRRLPLSRRAGAGRLLQPQQARGACRARRDSQPSPKAHRLCPASPACSGSSAPRP